jgi:hypothetical protein
VLNNQPHTLLDSWQTGNNFLNSQLKSLDLRCDEVAAFRLFFSLFIEVRQKLFL